MNTRGRHRAPSRLAISPSSLAKTGVAIAGTTSTFAMLVSASAQEAPRGVATAATAHFAFYSAQPVAIDAVGSGPQEDSVALDLLGTTLPAVQGPADRPARAVAAPAHADPSVSRLGFVGVTPAPQPVALPTRTPSPAASRSVPRAAAPAQSAPAPTPQSVTPQPVASPAPRTAHAPAPKAAPAPAPKAAPAPAPKAAPAPAPEPKPAPAPKPKPAPAPKPEPKPAPAPGGGAETAIAWAKSHLGLPYIFSSLGPAGYDCSGFTKTAYAQAGVSLPHGSGAQYNATARVPLSQIRRGDLLFYSRNGKIFHVAIYLGNGQVVHSLREWGGGAFDGSKISDMNHSPGLFAAGRP